MIHSEPDGFKGERCFSFFFIMATRKMATGGTYPGTAARFREEASNKCIKVKEYSYSV